jgi:hypothetical protein
MKEFPQAMHVFGVRHFFELPEKQSERAFIKSRYWGKLVLDADAARAGHLLGKRHLP